jgi:hypothetical protein
MRKLSLVWRLRSPHHSSHEAAMRTSEPKPHSINRLLVAFDSEVRKRRVPHNDANFAIVTLVLVIQVIIVIAPPAFAQNQVPAGNDRGTAAAAAPVKPAEPLTAKERLSEKWTDEQRVDNCKVPIDKRGPKPRPECSGTLSDR